MTTGAREESVAFTDLSAVRREVLFAIRSVRVNDGADPATEDVLAELENVAAGIGRGTVATALSWLADQGLVKRIEDPDDRRRRYYELTEDARRMLEAEVEIRRYQLGLDDGGDDRCR